MKPLNILVVDDNRLFREAFCTLLQECFQHIQIVPVADGLTALSLTRKIAFDLMILDYELTTITGSDIIRRLRARGGKLPPIILMSAHPDIAVFARLLAVYEYLPKPVSEEDLHEKLGPLIDRLLPVAA